MDIKNLEPLRPWDDIDFENRDYTVTVNGERQFVHNVRVDMHDRHTAAVCRFEYNGPCEVRISRKKIPINFVNIRPMAENIEYAIDGSELVLRLDRPVRLSVEIDGNRFNNLHLFAEKPAEMPEGRRLWPAVHRVEDAAPAAGETIVFMPGLHYIEETLLPAADGSTVFLAAGAVLVGSIVCDGVSGVRICGGGVIDLHSFARYSAFRGVKITGCNDVTVEGITIVNPPHYSVYLASSENIHIDGVKCFSCEGWSDGIDMMACKNVLCENLFMRNSDDCIAVYASRWKHLGGTKNITVRNSVLWADVAHPMNMGGHGMAGDVIENVSFENITVLNHHEPQEYYMGVMAINAGDGVAVRNVRYSNITVEYIERGRLFDVRTVKNDYYNKLSGKKVENVIFENISACCAGEPSVVSGYSGDSPVTGVTFSNVIIDGKRASSLEEARIMIGDFAENIAIN